MNYPEPDPQRTRALPNQDPAYTQPPPQQQPVVQPEQETAHSQAKRVRTVRMVCTAITFVCAFFAVILGIQIVLVLADANPANGVASFVEGFSSAVSLGFDGLFTPDSAKAAVLFNYGAAAIVWLLISTALTYLIRRFALPANRITE
ncbi:hypothetical protein JOF56_010694 [Kibdelosporangium banguiense]|uniref:Uncharacterized protein n=1 Tax=Kibdelosporangium banguiense TaxID=1365924 RepID=A0ABS4U270_9PSEU|nr:hypothetical protein [Kibdelosporangium banguiense]MBP2330309.1 hypothetical protein [Kibdelosporangium banguiense]